MLILNLDKNKVYNYLMNNMQTDPLDWWVVQTKPQSEDRVIRELSNQGFITYCPMYRKEILRAHKMKIKTTPLFPRYVFIQANQHAKETIHAIRSTYGVNILLKVGERPTLVSAQVIHNLKAIEVQSVNDADSYFKRGDTVKITKGLYQGLEAIFHLDNGLERVVVLLDFINKKTPLHISKNQLAKV